MNNNIAFIAEENGTNNEVFQLLNWRFHVCYCGQLDNISHEELRELSPNIVVVGMVGSSTDYSELFTYLSEECPDISVVSISSRADSEAYEKYYETKQFHRIIRPILGKQVLEVCREILLGKVSIEESDKDEKKHILVVDDNAMILRNIKRVLEERYTVAVAASGMQAFVSIRKKMPDLILLDYEMPQMNGKEVFKKLQTNDDLKEIPVVFLTSVDAKEIVMELLALKPAGYILKPVDTQMLLDKLEGILGK